VLSYEHSKGFGFIRSDACPGIDVYFQKKELPQSIRDRDNVNLKGKTVEFEVAIMPDGKPRAHRIRVQGGVGGGRGDGGGGGGDRKREDSGPPPPLDDETIERMIKVLEEKAGFMDFGKFSREFKAYKKSQLEEHFDFHPERDKSGRWIISLQGVEPTPFEEEDVPPPVSREDKRRAQDTQLGRFSGTINAFDQAKGYGFIKSAEALAQAPAGTTGDVYFKKMDLEAESRQLNRSALVGRAVEFDCILTHDGKPRGENINLVEAGEAGEKSDVPMPDLPPETVEAMIGFLEEQGGHMDYGRFANRFPGTKKAQIMQCDTFQLIPESDNTGGRWQIALLGVDPVVVAEAAADSAPPRQAERTSERSNAPPGPIAPSEGLWLIGCVKKWDPKKHFGFLVADGADDVFVHRNDLPPELQGNTNLMGVEMAFELMHGDDGKVKVRNAKPLIQPNGRGGWQLRRA